MPHTFPNVGKCCGMLWGGPPGLSGWACGPRIVMKTMWGGRPRLRRVSSRPACSPTGCAGFSTVRGSSRTRSSRNGTGGPWTPAARSKTHDPHGPSWRRHPATHHASRVATPGSEGELRSPEPAEKPAAGRIARPPKRCIGFHHYWWARGPMLTRSKTHDPHGPSWRRHPARRLPTALRLLAAQASFARQSRLKSRLRAELPALQSAASVFITIGGPRPIPTGLEARPTIYAEPSLLRKVGGIGQGACATRADANRGFSTHAKRHPANGGTGGSGDPPQAWTPAPHGLKRLPHHARAAQMHYNMSVGYLQLCCRH